MAAGSTISGLNFARHASTPAGVSHIAVDRDLPHLPDRQGLGTGFPHQMTSSIAIAGLSDLEVVSRLVAGDERALGALYDRYGPMAYSLACAIVPDSSDAEEVVAEAFSQIWRSAPTFDPSRGSVIAWVSTIVRTRSLDLLRSQKRRARVLDQAAAMAEDGSSPALSAGAPSPDRGVELSETQTLVRQSLAALPPTQRQVLELAYFGGLSQSEIAERLSEPLGTVKTRMRSGMEKLRQALGPLLGAAT
jgi:RNA polymerase sigma-70 factor, ECF subfamily